jgi:hypothetical protein
MIIRDEQIVARFEVEFATRVAMSTTCVYIDTNYMLALPSITIGSS